MTPQNTQGALLNLDFEGPNYDGNPTGTYTYRSTWQDLNASPGGHYEAYSVPYAQGEAPNARLQKVQDPVSGNKYLSKLTPAGFYNASGDPTKNDKVLLQWEAEKQYNELYLSYRVKAAEGFDFNRGGKLPGLCGGTCPTGGQAVTDADDNEDGSNSGAGQATGWSARNMWRDNQGKLVQYIYAPGDTGTWGVDKPYIDNYTGVRTRINDNEWHTVEHYVKMNTPGQTNGRLMAWVDGREVLRLDGLRFRDDYSYGIDTLKISSYFGGHDPSWAPSNDSYLYLDDIVVSEKRISH